MTKKVNNDQVTIETPAATTVTKSSCKKKVVTSAIVIAGVSAGAYVWALKKAAKQCIQGLDDAITLGEQADVDGLEELRKIRKDLASAKLVTPKTLTTATKRLQDWVTMFFDFDDENSSDEFTEDDFREVEEQESAEDEA